MFLREFLSLDIRFKRLIKREECERGRAHADVHCLDDRLRRGKGVPFMLDICSERSSPFQHIPFNSDKAEFRKASEKMFVPYMGDFMKLGIYYDNKRHAANAIRALFPLLPISIDIVLVYREPGTEIRVKNGRAISYKREQDG